MRANDYLRERALVATGNLFDSMGPEVTADFPVELAVTAVVPLPIEPGCFKGLLSAFGCCAPSAPDLEEVACEEILLSISSKIFLLPPAAANSFCFRSRSAACFCFQASSFASLSAFFSASVGAGGGFGVYFAFILAIHHNKKQCIVGRKLDSLLVIWC